MKFREFEAKMKDLGLFNLNEVRKLESDFHRQQLSDWQERGWIRPVAGGYYILADREINEGFLFMLANKIYEPSYVSLESALAYYSVIPETVMGVSSVSSRKTRQLDSKWGSFRYRKIKAEYLNGYKVVKEGGVKYLMARLEKAVLDYLYLNPQIETKEDFEALRWNRDELEGIRESQWWRRYLAIFDNGALNDRVEQLYRYLDA